MIDQYVFQPLQHGVFNLIEFLRFGTPQPFFKRRQRSAARQSEGCFKLFFVPIGKKPFRRHCLFHPSFLKYASYTFVAVIFAPSRPNAQSTSEK